MEVSSPDVFEENLLTDMLVQGSNLLCNLENLLWIGAILYRVLIFSWNFFSLENWKESKQS